MSFKEVAAQAKPDTSNIERKITIWKNARSAATNKIIICPDWLRTLCYELPQYADDLLAWLLESSAYIGHSNEVILVHRSKTWEEMVNQFLFRHLRRDYFFTALRKVLDPVSVNQGARMI